MVRAPTLKKLVFFGLFVAGCTEMTGDFCSDVPSACADAGSTDAMPVDARVNDGAPSDAANDGAGPDAADASPGKTYRVRGTLYGATSPVRLQLTAVGAPEDLVVPAPGAFAFAGGLPTGTRFTVAVSAQPSAQFCTVIGGSGQIGTADVDAVQVVCAANRTIFLSSQTYTGAIGGIAGADARCQALATAAGLRKGMPSTFLAWYSGDGVSPQSRFTRPTVPYVLVNGTVVANGWGDLTDGSLAHAINLTEAGTPGPRITAGSCTNAVRTGTSLAGAEVVGETCVAGTSAEATDRSALGDIEQTGAPQGVSGAFTNACGAPNCQIALPIYCVEQ